MDYDYRKLIKTLRNKLVMTQEELADYLDVSFASVNRWERGHFKPTTKAKRQIIKLCIENDINLEMGDN